MLISVTSFFKEHTCASCRYIFHSKRYNCTDRWQGHYQVPYITTSRTEDRGKSSATQKNRSRMLAQSSGKLAERSALTSSVSGSQQWLKDDSSIWLQSVGSSEGGIQQVTWTLRYTTPWHLAITCWTTGEAFPRLIETHKGACTMREWDRDPG